MRKRVYSLGVGCRDQHAQIAMHWEGQSHLYCFRISVKTATYRTGQWLSAVSEFFLRLGDAGMDTRRVVNVSTFFHVPPAYINIFNWNFL